MGPLLSAYWHKWRDFIDKITGTPHHLQSPLGLRYQSVEWSQELEFMVDTENNLFRWKYDTEAMYRYPHKLGQTTRIQRYKNETVLTSLMLANIPSPMFTDATEWNGQLIITASLNCLTTSHNNTKCNKPSMIKEYCEQKVLRGLQWLVGEIKWPEDWGRSLTKTLKEKRLISMSDGSIKDGSGTHAWTITTGHKGSTLRGRGPIDRAKSYMSSFRMELQGQTAIIIIVGMMANIAEGQIKTYFDNQGVRNQLKQQWQTTKLCFHNESDTDLMIILNALWKRVRKINVNWRPGWVKGHKDDKYPQ